MDIFGRERIQEHKDEIDRIAHERQRVIGQAHALRKWGSEAAKNLESYWLTRAREFQVRHNTVRLKAADSRWTSSDNFDWKAWSPDETLDISTIRIGELTEGRTQKFPFVMPAYAPFVGKHKTIIIATSPRSHAQGLALLQSLVVRTALMLPHQARYTLLDPAGAGMAFPMRRHLAHVRETGSDVRRDLDQVSADIQHIITTYLDAEVKSFEQIPSEMRVNERFQFVFAANFPEQYDRRAIEALQQIANTGMAAGVYLFIHLKKDMELPRDMSMTGFKSAAIYDLDDPIVVKNLTLRPDSAPDAEMQAYIFEKLKGTKPIERTIEWDQKVGLKPDQWWKGDATHLVSTPIGAKGKGEDLNIWFGATAEGQICAHGALSATTGGGKSTLYHTLITGLAVRYSPEELRLYLIDGKNGIEFRPYRYLPHAEVVSLRSSPELSRSVLTELIAEMDRRSTLFHKVGVEGLQGYRAKGQPYGKLPRILLFVDEYQQLFEDDTDEVASGYLRRLSEQGRAFGIHMFLGSQRFDVAGLLNKDKVFGNIHLRAALRMTASDVQTLTEFGRRGRAMIESISQDNIPGKIVINDNAGSDGGNANHTGKVAFLKSVRRDELVLELTERAQTLSESSLPRRVVFDGKAQPVLTENPELTILLQMDEYPSAETMEEIARKSIHENGFNVANWFGGEKPYIAWLGQQHSVRGQAKVVFRRRTGENAVVVGAENSARYGMLCSLIASLCLNAVPDQTRFVIFDRSLNSASWGSALQTVYSTLLQPNEFSSVFSKDGKALSGILDDLVADLDRRKALDEDSLVNEPSLFAVFTELDTLDAIRRKASSYGAMANTPDGDKLARLHTEGAPLGIHLILSFSGVQPMSSVIDARASLSNFRHRIALQMSDDNSHAFVRSRQAATLQSDGPVPINALYLDTENDTAVRFKPYTTEAISQVSESIDTLAEQIAHISQALSSRHV